MSRHFSMSARVAAYLLYRRGLGYQLKIEGQMLGQFAEFADRNGHRGPITTEVALRWARSTSGTDRLDWTRRLEVVRCLARHDLDLDRGLLCVRQTKFRKTRWVPLHPTATAALRAYADLRDRTSPRCDPDRFFVNDLGLPLPYSTVRNAFRKLCNGFRISGSRRQPRLHDLRHTFACRRIEEWSAAGIDLPHGIAALSTYLGHAKVTDTYWYLTATPDLMARAAAKFERFDALTPGEGQS